MDSAGSTRPGKTLGEYQLLEELGHGSFGVVFRAQRAGSPRQYALKLLRNEADWRGVQRFHLEVIVGRKLSLPGIVGVVDAGRAPGGLYAAMDYVPGPTLERRLRGPKPLTHLEGAEMVAAMARAIGAAHGQGIVHRDLKPANVIVEAGTERPWITDLGMVQDHSVMELTQTGEGLGTPLYMAPEQCRGARDVDARADVYSLGVILYECLTGTLPFMAPTSREVMEPVQRGGCARPRDIDPTIPQELERICLLAISHDRTQRPPSGIELAEALDDWIRATTIPSFSAETTALGRVARGVSPALMVSASLALVGLAAVAVVLRSAPPQDDPPASQALEPSPSTPAWPPGQTWGDVPTPPHPDDDELIEGPGWAMASGASRARLEHVVGELRRRGLRPISLHANSDRRVPNYSAVWGADPGRWEIEFELAEERFEAACLDRRERGLEVECLAVAPGVLGRKLTVVWSESEHPRQATAGMTARAYQGQFNEAKKTKPRPRAIWLAGVGADSETRLALVFSRGRPSTTATHPRKPAAFADSLLLLLDGGKTLTCAMQYGTIADPRWGGLWSKQGETTLVYDLDGGEHRAFVDVARDVGFRPVFLLRRGPLGQARFTSSWLRSAGTVWRVTGERADDGLDVLVEETMRRHGVSRGAFAMVRGGTLQVSRGYALLPDSAEETHPQARFRLGSLSTLLTAAVTEDLAESGQLSLNDPVAKYLDPFERWGRPTIQDLLLDRSGWPDLTELAGPKIERLKVFSREKTPRPRQEEAELTLSPNRRLGWEGLLQTLADRAPRPLAEGAPPQGQDVGYALLAGVVAAASGSPYPDAVRQLVLDPAGVSGIAPAGTRPSERLPGEVSHDEPGLSRDVLRSGGLLPPPYAQRDLKTFAGYAGWVGSATELARFVATSPPEAGWQSDGARRWASSSQPGASGYVELLPDGTVWVLLLNRSADLEPLAARIREVSSR